MSGKDVRQVSTSRKVSIDQLADAVNVGLEEYADLAVTEMKAAVRSVSNTVKNEIKANSPRGTSKKHYADGWATKVTSEDSHSLNITIYNKSKPGLTHLLEHGHALRQGGRASAYPHIAPAEQNGIALLESKIAEALRE